MTARPPVSVIVVSHGRPALLRRALIGIGQLFYRPFELVVVADAEGLTAISDLPFSDRIKTVTQDIPNISAARNRGAELASGDALAFIDDDAVPEPTWLDHLIFPFLETDVAATTGTVLGRNGISIQWVNRCVDAHGQARQIGPDGVPANHAIKLEGTNMAIRREVLFALGGFDEGFGFYLDETDLAFRLMTHGYRTAIAPLATVHHGFAASNRRTEARVPLDLSDIGSSTVRYLHKHARPGDIAEAVGVARAEQQRRLDRLVRARLIGKDEAARLLNTLIDGLQRDQDPVEESFLRRDLAASFRPLLTKPSDEPVVLAGRWFSRRNLMNQAGRAASSGRSTSLFLLDHTIRAHRVQFTPDGVWLQSGGLFGRTQRDSPRFSYWSFNQRIRMETGRLHRIRWN